MGRATIGNAATDVRPRDPIPLPQTIHPPLTGVAKSGADKQVPAPTRIARNECAGFYRPDRPWVVDITYVPTWSWFLFFAVVIDACSRRVVGWVMANHLRTELVLDALNMAIWQRRPEGVIHHSDQGTQYTSIAFGARCKEVKVRPSMGSVGDC